MNNNSSIHIKIDPDIAKLIPEYLENRQRDIQTIEEARWAVELGMTR